MPLSLSPVGDLSPAGDLTPVGVRNLKTRLSQIDFTTKRTRPPFPLTGHPCWVYLRSRPAYVVGHSLLLDTGILERWKVGTLES